MTLPFNRPGSSKVETEMTLTAVFEILKSNEMQKIISVFLGITRNFLHALMLKIHIISLIRSITATPIFTLCVSALLWLLSL